MKIADFFRKLRYVLMTALVTYGLHLCFATMLLPENLPYILRYIGVYFLFAAVGMLCPKKLRFLPAILGMAALAVPVILYTGGMLRIYSGMISVAYCILLALTLPIGSWHYKDEVSEKNLIIGFLLLGLCCFCATFYGALKPQLPLFKAVTLLYGLLTVLSVNRLGWLLATGGKKSYSRAMRWKNRIFACLMFAVALIPAWLISPMRLMGGIWRWLSKGVGNLAEKWGGETPESVQIESSGNIIGGVAVKDLNIGVILYVTALCVLGVGFVVILITTLIRDGKSKKGAVRYSEDFSDEVTRTRGKKGKDFPELEPEEEEKAEKMPLFYLRMSPEQKIRFRYRQISRKHPEWKESNTARENLPPSPAGLYEQARYSPHPVSEADAENFRKGTKKHR